MDLNNSNDLLKRKKIGMMDLCSKNENYEITSIYIKRYISKDKIPSELSLKFEKKMLKYFSYEISRGFYVRLFFDFISCKQELGIDINGSLPVPYLLRINIIDNDIKATKKNYVLSLIANEINNYEDRIFDITFKKVDCPENDDFVLYFPGLYGEHYIVHKYELDWKKYWLLEQKKYIK